MDVVPDDAFDEVEVEPSVYLAQLAAGEEISIQHLRMEPDARDPDHSHHHEQVGVVYKGEQTFLLDFGGSVTVGPGESYRLESNEVHATENRGDDQLRAIDVFSPPRLDPNWLD